MNSPQDDADQGGQQWHEQVGREQEFLEQNIDACAAALYSGKSNQEQDNGTNRK